MFPKVHPSGVDLFFLTLEDKDLFYYITRATRKLWPLSRRVKEEDASIAIGMDNRYRDPSDNDARRPINLSKSSLLFFDGIQSKLAYSNPHRESAFRIFLKNSFADLVFGSNKIEGIDYSHSSTADICSNILEGLPVITSVASVPHKIKQHALALKYIIDDFVLKDSPLDEFPIRETHYHLCNGIPTKDDPTGSNRFTGRYRTEKLIPRQMAKLVKDFNLDIDKADNGKLSDGTIDPFMLAAKYCHRLAMIQPFNNGNGRMSRLLLNAILLKYAGIVIGLGLVVQDKEEYLRIIRNSATTEQSEPDENRPPWAALATLVLKHANEKLSELDGSLVLPDR